MNKKRPSRLVKAIDTRWRLATAGLRMLPSFAIIGIQKGGSTSLYHHLIDHPNVIPPKRKEIQLFDRGDDFSPKLYRSWFPLERIGLNGAPAITGEATPTYLVAPNAPAHLAAVVPDIKLIVTLRDPVMRAVSHYRHNVRSGRESLSFSDALEAETERIRDSLAVHEGRYPDSNIRYILYGYKRSGEYARHLKHWLEYFDTGQFKVIEAERYWSKPQDVMYEVQDFLGLPPHKHGAFPVYNRASRELDVPPDDFEALRSYFAPHNEELYELIGRRFNWE